jgi:tetratricopeptide (TPR) repeat protein
VPSTNKPGKGWEIVALFVLVIAIAAAGWFYFKKPPTPLEQAVSLIKANRHAAALPLLEQLEKKEPDNDEVFPWLAQCYLRTDRLAEGRTALDTALKCKLPSSLTAPVVLSFAEYYENKNDYEEAERLFASARNSSDDKDLRPGQAQLYVRWGEAEAAVGQHERALKHLQQAFAFIDEKDLGRRTTLPHRIGELYRHLAAVAETQQNDDQRAIQLLQDSLRWADEPASRMALGNLYLRHDETAKAIDNFKIVVAQDGNNLEARHHLIDLYLQAENLEGAQQALLELTERERSVENFDQLANVNLKLGNYAGAVRALEDAIVLHPKDIELLTELHDALARWSTVLTKQDKIDEAASVKGHAERVAELLKQLQKQEEPPTTADKSLTEPGAESPPVSLIASRMWLSKGSFTPEGEIRLKNISGKPVTDLALTMVFWDNTTKKKNSTITVSAASETHPMDPGAIQSVYFSCPNIVKAEHQLAVIIFWKGRLLKELPVVKER